MAQIKRNFLKSKMNKDLDARLIPNGEYREARNINISKSEGSDVGALENIKGNSSIVTTFLNDIQAAIPEFERLNIIGLHADESTSSLYLFITSWTDNSSDRLSNKFRGHNYIAQIVFNKNEYTPKILVKGQFLNFSKNSPIYNVDVLEGILYWTDNRNQPRKININKAYSSGSLEANPNHNTDYYYHEDQISVAKFAPYESIKFVKNTGSAAGDVWEPTWKVEDEEFLPTSLIAPITSLNTDAQGNVESIVFGNQGAGNNNGLVSAITNYFNKAANDNFPLIRLKNYTLPNAPVRYVHEIVNRTVSGTINKNDTTSSDFFPTTWQVGHYITFELKNPQFKVNAGGDKKFLEDKFIRFSYRFKYDDNEYSLMAPFTQPLFISKNFNQFLAGNEAQAARTGEVSWFKNIISSAELIIQLPDLSYRSFTSNSTNLTFENRYKVKEIEILLKSSTDNNVYSIDNIDVTDNQKLEESLVNNSFTTWPNAFQYSYQYNGNKPFQVLPERDVTRVSDATPVRALTQEIAGNRVMYGNYLNGHGAPNSLNYELFVGPKMNQYDSTSNPPIPPEDPTLVKEYYSSTVKQGRTYQVGVILSDRYGRQSNVILADTQFKDFTEGRDNSTVYVPYDNDGISGSVDNFWGNSLKVAFRSEIPESPNPIVNFYPGLYDSATNPLGWYSYRIVVKQSEQEYYNVYLAGALSGQVIYKNNETPLEYDNIYSVSNISLMGGNINKIPKNTSNISSTDKTFSSDTSLYYRVIQTVFDDNDIYNNFQNVNVQPYSVTSIQSFLDFAPWANTKGSQQLDDTGQPVPSIYPNDFASPPVYIDPVYFADKNPFIATLDLSAGNFRLGFPDFTQEGNSGSTPILIPRFSKFLNVAETNPTLSNLDIYWETTTSGLIGDLNQEIRTGGDPNAIAKTSPFLFLYEEQYPYDGKGMYSAVGNGPGDYLLQQDLVGLTSAGQVINGTDVSMGNEIFPGAGIYNITVKTVDGVDVSTLFVIELVEQGSNNTPNKFNIRFRDSNVVDNSYYIPNVGLLLQKELIFTFDIARPGFSPSSVTVQYSNNKMSNNAPKWEYIKPSVWGNDADSKPNPNSTQSVINTPNTQFIDNNIILGLECVPLSPFTPVDDNTIKDMLQANGGGTGSALDATYFNPRRNEMWNMSIKGQTRAQTSSLALSYSSSSIGEGMFGPNDAIWGDKSNDNSAVKFNGRMLYNNFEDACDGFFKYSNGSFIRNTDGVTPIITDIELALFRKNTSYENYDKNQSILPGYGNQGAEPVQGFSPFLFTPPQQNDPGLTFYNQDGIQRYAYAENFPPFVIVALQPGLSYLVNTLDPSGYWSVPSGKQGAYCLLVDPYHPPFNQFDSKNGSKIDPLGNLTNGDLVVYKLTVVLREDFAPNRISIPQEIFIKLSK